VDAIRVTVRRGTVVEAVHRVHARSTAGGWYGDDLTCFLRSSLKPIQAVPLADAYPDLGDDELAIACASHQAEPAQLDAARKLLARAEAAVDDLENGTQDGRPEGKLGHNCSGKHAGMLASCRANGWPLHPYRDRAHPLQRRIAELVGPGEVAIDGCGVPTFSMELTCMGALFLTTPVRVADAMRARPKRGAEGLFCAADGEEAWVLKVEDGSSRALRPALGAIFDIPEFREVPVTNSLGEVVGSVSA
jgi:L-asparaginase II